MHASELHPASETALREWQIDRRVNRSGVSDDDPGLLEPIESGLLYYNFGGTYEEPGLANSELANASSLILKPP